MRLRKFRFYAGVICGALFLICQGCGKSASGSAEAVDSVNTEVEKEQADDSNDNESIKKVVQQWNSSLNNRDSKKSLAVFADKVQFYTQEVSAEKATKLRIELAEKDPSWHQSIVTDIEIVDLGDGIKEASFTKQSNSQKGIRSYPAYLCLKKINGEWKIIKESDKVTDRNVSEEKVSVPADAIRGDFDGDGAIDYVWIDGSYDNEGYAKGALRLRSNRPSLDGMSWSATRGVALVNLGDLNNSNRDFLGAVPFYDSNWTSYEVFGWKNGKWKPVIDSFSVWMGDEDMNRVWKSDRKGYVEIKLHDMAADPDNMFEPQYKTVKLNW